MIIMVIALGILVGSSYNEKNVKKTTKEHYDIKFKEASAKYPK